MIRYLTAPDYRMVATAEDWSILTYDGDQYAISQAEVAAVEQAQAMVRAYARGTYDLARIFIPVWLWAADIAYQVGQHVHDAEGIMYVTLQPAQGIALSDASYFIQRDDRSPMVRMYLADMALYHLYSHIMPENVPELRQNRFRDAVGFWKRVRDGVDDPGFPMVEGSEALRYTTNRKRKWYI